MRTWPSASALARRHGAQRGRARRPEGRRPAAARARRRPARSPLPTFQAMADVDPLNRRVVEQMLVGVATRRYARSLEPVPATMREPGHEQERGESPLRGEDDGAAGGVADRARSTASTWSAC